jgi:putative tricarboxylic transport membrane protein
MNGTLSAEQPIWRSQGGRKTLLISFLGVSSDTQRRYFMGTKLKFSSELVFRFILLFLGLLISIVSFDYGIGTIKQPGTGVFTLVLGILILGAGLINIISADKKEDKEPLFGNKTEITKFIFTGLVLVLWIVGLSYLGFIMMTFFVTLLMSKVIGLEGWLKPVALSLVTSFFIYLLFDYWLYIDLPKGFLG